jgi:aryl-alcohol dehydrogenase-like predicted oxidoreductase
MQYTSINKIQISKLTLGTAQLGSTYGIANRVGKPDDQVACAILKTAVDRGVNCFDTAPSYGNSEEVIGNHFVKYKNSVKPPVIITKLSPLHIEEKINFHSVYFHVKQKVTSSMRKLHLDYIPIFLFHRASDIQLYDGLILESCLKIKEEGMIGSLGVSVYSPQEAELLLHSIGIDVIQVPLNIFDHRLVHSGQLSQLSEKQVIVFARSIFLQGLFFLDTGKLPENLDIAREPLKKLNQFSRDCGISIPELALNFVRDLPGVTSVIIGAETPQQVKNNIDLMNSPGLPPGIKNEILKLFSNLPIELVNPSLWRPQS